MVDAEMHWPSAWVNAGLEGSDDHLSLRFCGASLLATPRRNGLIYMTATCVTARTWTGHEAAVPPTLDDTEVRHLVCHLILSVVPVAHHRNVEEGFGIGLSQAIDITEKALDRGDYQAWFGLDFTLPGAFIDVPLRSVEKYAAELVAVRSADEAMLARLVLKHPDFDVRLKAFRNSHCPAAVDAALAETITPDAINLLLLKPNADPAAFARAAETFVRLQLADKAQILGILCNELCPPDVIPALVAFYIGKVARRRLELTAAAITFEVTKRRVVYSEVLRHARTCQTTSLVLKSIASDPDDEGWLLYDAPSSLRRLARRAGMSDRALWEEEH